MADTSPRPNFHTNDNSKNNVDKQEIQAAIAKAVELRALHAALLQGNNSPSAQLASFRSVSPLPRHDSHISAQDYPVFTPSYRDIPRNQRVLDEYSLNGGGNEDFAILSDHKNLNISSRKLFPSELAHIVPHICPSDDQRSVTASSAKNITLLGTSPGPDYTKSRRNSLGDFRSSSSCNQCNPANVKYSNTAVPMTDSHSSHHSHPKTRGLKFSWLFSRLKKKHKNENSPNRTEPEEVSQIYKDLGILSIDALKKEIGEANERRDAALMEASQMKSSLGELRDKLEYLETYCEELKKALIHEKQERVHDSHVLNYLPKGGNLSATRNGEDMQVMPVTEEVMVEGLMQIVSEARLAVKHFCKTLVAQIDETDSSLMDSIIALLQPYNLSLSSKYSKVAIYHLESVISQSLYEDFENCVFRKNGTAKILNPQQDRQEQFSSFCALRNLSWNEVLRKGTKYYSEEFSKFCDQKMNGIVTALNWTRPWPEQLLQAFFVAAKCIWLLHLLAFSFYPTVGIFRVEESRSFESHYMEDVFAERQKSQHPSRVKIMVMPGFYVQDKVIKCKVLCKYRSVA